MSRRNTIAKTDPQEVAANGRHLFSSLIHNREQIYCHMLQKP